MKGPHDVASVKMQWENIPSSEITPRKFCTGNLFGPRGKKTDGIHKMGCQSGEGPSAQSEQFPEGEEKSARYLGLMGPVH